MRWLLFDQGQGLFTVFYERDLIAPRRQRFPPEVLSFAIIVGHEDLMFSSHNDNQLDLRARAVLRMDSLAQP